MNPRPLLLASVAFTSAFSASTFAQTNTYPFPASGNVGIGTTSPAAKLHVGQSNQEIRFDYNGTDSFYGSLRWAGLQLGNNGANRFVAGRTMPGGLFDFYVNNTNEAADYNQSPNGILAMRISSSGNVGIGTTSPLGKLSVTNTTAYDGDESNWTADSISLYGAVDNASGDYFGGITWHNGARRRAGIASVMEHADSDYVGLAFFTQGTDGPGPMAESMRITRSGNVGIGTTNPTHKLAVNGTIKAKEVIVETGWSDYVFADDYALAPLAEVEAHIKEHKHLPGIPSAAQVAANGVSLGEVQAALLAKVEEITLHQIAQQKELASLRAENAALKTRVQQLEIR
jgi:hypothetical protein